MENVTQKFMQYIGIPKDALQTLNTKKQEHFVRNKIKMMNFYVLSIQLYFYRRMLRIPKTKHVINKNGLRKTGAKRTFCLGSETGS